MTVLSIFNALTNAYMQYIENRDCPVLNSEDERRAFELISERFASIKPLLESFMSLDIAFKHFELMPSLMGFLSRTTQERPFERMKILLDQQEFHNRHGIAKSVLDEHDINKIVNGEFPNMKKNSKIVRKINAVSGNMIRLYRIIHDKYPSLEYGFDSEYYKWPGFRISIDPRTIQ